MRLVLAAAAVLLLILLPTARRLGAGQTSSSHTQETTHDDSSERTSCGVFLASLLFGLPLIARELGASALAICENKCKEKIKCHHQRT